MGPGEVPVAAVGPVVGAAVGRLVDAAVELVTGGSVGRLTHWYVGQAQTPGGGGTRLQLLSGGGAHGWT